MTVRELLTALETLVLEGHAMLEVLALHTGTYDEVPVTEVALDGNMDTGAQWVVLR